MTRPLDSAACQPSIAQVRYATRQVYRALRAGALAVDIRVAEDGSVSVENRGD